MSVPALVLDFGGPVLVTPFEVVASDATGTVAHEVLAGRGPLADPSAPDQDWVRLQEGTLSERTFWDDRAREWEDAGGGQGGVRGLVASLYHPPRRDLIRDGARSLLDAARAAGRATAVLTNDLRAFHSAQWIDAMGVPGLVDVVVDGSVEGVLKPDAAPYRLVAQRLGVSLHEMVFVDDQEPNVRGARDLGIPTVHFDVTDPASSFGAARALLRLPVEG